MMSGFISTTIPLTGASNRAPATSPRRTRSSHAPAHTRRGMTMTTASPPQVLDTAGRPVAGLESVNATLDVFKDFFMVMEGSWNSERTYHYVDNGMREDSQTTFDVLRLDDSQVSDVLLSNGDQGVMSPEEKANSQGFKVSFNTRMASQKELVRNSTNLAFIPRSIDERGLISGDYFRDLGYEEAGPIRAKFVFDAAKRQLNMTTTYSRVVSVDQISLISPTLRLRKIINYVRPDADLDPLNDVALVGFGVELKGVGERLVI